MSEKLDRTPRITSIEVRPTAKSEAGIILQVVQPNHQHPFQKPEEWTFSTEYLRFFSLDELDQYIRMLRDVHRKLMFSSMLDEPQMPPPASEPEQFDPPAFRDPDPEPPAAAPAATEPRTPAFTVDREGSINIAPINLPAAPGTPDDDMPF